MNPIENEFFEEFKQLEDLCQQIFGRSANNKLSVTRYLDDMQENKYQGEIKVPEWKYQYKRLKDCRNKRNNLVHPNDRYSDPCSQDDIDFVVSFRKAILNQTDPLALLEKSLHSKKPHKATTNHTAKPTPNDNSMDMSAFIIFGCIVIVLLLIACILFTAIFPFESLLGAW